MRWYFLEIWENGFICLSIVSQYSKLFIQYQLVYLEAASFYYRKNWIFWLIQFYNGSVNWEQRRTVQINFPEFFHTVCAFWWKNEIPTNEQYTYIIIQVTKSVIINSRRSIQITITQQIIVIKTPNRYCCSCPTNAKCTNVIGMSGLSMRVKLISIDPPLVFVLRGMKERGRNKSNEKEVSRVWYDGSEV